MILLHVHCQQEETGSLSAGVAMVVSLSAVWELGLESLVFPSFRFLFLSSCDAIFASCFYCVIFPEMCFRSTVGLFVIVSSYIPPFSPVCSHCSLSLSLCFQFLLFYFWIFYLLLPGSG